MALGVKSAKLAFTRFCWLLVLAVLLEHAVAEPASTAAPSSRQSSTSSPPPKEKRSQEDIMFGNQQNKPASGMVDELFQTQDSASKNASQKAGPSEHVSEKPVSKGPAGEPSGSEHRQTLAELPDRLDYYDYIQPESGDMGAGVSPTGDEDDLEEEDAERNSFFAPQDPPSFGSQKLLAAPSAQIDRNELGDYPTTEEEYESSPSNNLLYRRRKRGAFRRLRSPLEDLLGPSGAGGPFRRRRASSGPMRLKRDAASNELLNWLALLHRSQAPRRGNREEIAFQEFQGLEPEPLELSGDTGYLYEPLLEEEDIEDEEALPLPEEGPEGDSLEWDIPVRAPPRRRSSPFYPLDYRYVLLPGARKRTTILGAPGGHFGAMREVNRWPGEPQSGRWGNFPLLNGQRLGLPVRRAPAQIQESDAERLYALASLLAAPGPSSRDSDEDLRRRRRSPRNPVLRG